MTYKTNTRSFFKTECLDNGHPHLNSRTLLEEAGFATFRGAPIILGAGNLNFCNDRLIIITKHECLTIGCSNDGDPCYIRQIVLEDGVFCIFRGASTIYGPPTFDFCIE